jgi:hypothetical protein
MWRGDDPAANQCGNATCHRLAQENTEDKPAAWKNVSHPGKKTIILKKSVGYPVFCCGLFSEPEFLIGYRWSQMDGSDQEITMFSSKIDIG